MYEGPSHLSIVHCHICVQSYTITVVVPYEDLSHALAGQVGLGVGSWPRNRATEGSNPKGTRLYFVILLMNVEKIFDWH